MLGKVPVTPGVGAQTFAPAQVTDLHPDLVPLPGLVSCRTVTLEQERCSGAQSGGGSSWRSVAQAPIKAEKAQPPLSGDFPSQLYSTDAI